MWARAGNAASVAAATMPIMKSVNFIALVSVAEGSELDSHIGEEGSLRKRMEQGVFRVGDVIDAERCGGGFGEFVLRAQVEHRERIECGEDVLHRVGIVEG